MNYFIKTAAVIGAGTMGAAIAAHLANAGIRVLLLDIVPQKLSPEQEAKGMQLTDQAVRNSIAALGLERAVRSKPASFLSESRKLLVDIGNLEDDFDRLGDVDWIIEVIVENLTIKQDLMARIDKIRHSRSIVSTNTSGIPIAAIQSGCSENFKQHFLGTHFFNPPRYLKLLELIPSPDTLPEVVQVIKHFCEYRLGKGVVICKDTPNFIGNRIGFGGGAFTLDFILRNGYTVDEVDAITGPLIGRPKTATFRLMDLVGIDVWEHVGKNLTEAIPNDQLAQPYLQSEPVNSLIGTMVGRGWLGNKSEVGFYKQIRSNGKREFWALNLLTLEHEPPQKPRFESIGKARGIENLGERIKVMMAGDDRASELVNAITYQGFAYASARIPEIADSPKPIDDAMRWGYSHEAGPFELWDMLGVEATIEPMRRAGHVPAAWVSEMLSVGCTTFYEYQNGMAVGVYYPEKKKYVPLEISPNKIVIKDLKTLGKVVLENPGAALIDLGDGVGCIEFHTKMNALDDDIFNLAAQALDLADDGKFIGLVIGNDAENFSAGANLGMVLLAAHMGMWDQLEEAIDKLQSLNMRMRYFSKPIVAAPVGLALGGGSEVIMHTSRVVACAELYAGLVEVGVGVIPAGAGTKEMLRRVLNPAMLTNNVDPLPFLQRIFEQIGMAKVGTSADEVRAMGILNTCDRIVMNRSYLLAEAKKEVLQMQDAGYSPPLPEKIFAAGRDALAAIRVGIYMYWKAKQITEYDRVVAEKLAYVMTGGDISAPAWVDEKYILELEKESFLYLCGREETRARMKHMLDTGKPLRN